MSTEEMKEIDSLLDLMDDLNVDQDLTALGDDDDDDDGNDTWSQPASSVFDDDILEDSLLL